MKKIYATLAAALLCAASSQAAINVTLDGVAIPNGGTVTIGRDAFNHLYWEDGGFVILDTWQGKVDIEIESSAPTQVDLVASDGAIQFCPAGVGCFTTFRTPGGTFEGNGIITLDKTSVAVDIAYHDKGENLPADKQTLKATLTDKSGDVFVINFLFDTTDSGVDGIAADGLVNVYSIAGYQLLNQAPADALRSLPAGLYIVNGKKMIIK